MGVCCVAVIGGGLAPILWLCAPLLIQHSSSGERSSNAGVLLANSLAVGALTAGLALLFGLPVAFALRSARGALRAAMMMLSLLPLIVPPFIAAIAWIEILNRGGSPPFTAHGLLAGLPVSENTIAILESSWVLALCFFPCVTWAAVIALTRCAPELEDDMRLQGGESAITRHLALPFLAAPALVSAVLVFFYLSLNSA